MEFSPDQQPDSDDDFLVEVDQACGWCGEATAQWYCDKCTAHYCGGCWTLLPLHRKPQFRHTQMSSFEYMMFGKILKPSWTDEEREFRYRRDISALWFSVDRKESGELEFEDFPRFNQLMFEHRQEHGGSASYYSRLVSFIGTTGAGKSTLIRMLMERPWKARNNRQTQVEHFAVPVVGRRESTVPTSGDVHLYRDSLAEGEETSRPILYADCEGFHGGEQLPASLLARKTAGSSSQDPADSQAHNLSNLAKMSYAYLKCGIKRVLNMPSRITDPSRESVVLELFPRLLYNFSDVVVHVLTQTMARTLENDLVRLLDWAQTSLESAVNRATLPHLIIVINNCTEGTQWDTVQITETIFEEQKRILEENSTVREYKRKFERLGVVIATVEDLLKCFYSTVQFVKLPEWRDCALLSTQLRKLHSLIDEASLSAQLAKSKAKLLLNSQDQELFYRLAFQHYSTDLDKPFDFLEKLFALHPLPNNISNNCATLLTAAHRALGGSLSPEQFCAVLAPSLSSAIALDAARSYVRLPGHLTEIFKGEFGAAGGDARAHSYEYSIRKAFDSFGDLLPCSFIDGRGKRCVNTRNAHTQHQDSQGEPLTYGPFISEFADGVLKFWQPEVEQNLQLLDEMLEQAQIRELSSGDAHGAKLNATWSIHRDNVESLYGAFPKLETYNFFTCFMCLRGIAAEVLPCWHAICASCLKACGEVDNSGDSRAIRVHSCVLHAAPVQFDPGHVVHPKPAFTGSRILALDGGGVRGIVELKILEAIEKRLGGKIPIQRFFDMIGGTSTGGIIAICLGIKDWSVANSIILFKNICQRAFQKHSDFEPAQWFQFLVTQGCKYKSDPLEETLKLTFGEASKSSMLQAKLESSGHNLQANKVFVTATVDAGDKGTVITNYIRPRIQDFQDKDTETLSYEFEISNSTKGLLTVWESARATTAAPSYFKPFRKGFYGKEYWDGGLFNNNPARIGLCEAKRLWGQSATDHPDLLLSIGCGYGTQQQRGPLTLASMFMSLVKNTPLFRTIHVLAGRLLQSINSEVTWIDNFGSLEDSMPGHYARMNPKFPAAPPDLDDIATLEDGSLESVADGFLASPATQSKINTIVRRLIATSFYFHPLHQIPLDEGGGTFFAGHIRCRFLDHGDEIRAFAETIVGLHGPYFEMTYPQRHTWHIDQDKIDHMRTRGEFMLEVNFQITGAAKELDIKLVARGFQEESISASPMKVPHQDNSALFRSLESLPS